MKKKNDYSKICCQARRQVRGSDYTRAFLEGDTLISHFFSLSHKIERPKRWSSLLALMSLDSTVHPIS